VPDSDLDELESLIRIQIQMRPKIVPIRNTVLMCRATITTLNPKDKIYSEVMEKFKRQIFINNVMRIKAVILGKSSDETN
jgi:hypothetical protein